MKFLPVLLLVSGLTAACSAKKTDVASAEALGSAAQKAVSYAPCAHDYDPLPLHRSDNAVMLPNLEALPKGLYQYKSGQIYTFVETGSGEFQAHYTETVNANPLISPSFTTVCADDTLPKDLENIQLQTVSRYEYNAAGKSLMGRTFMVTVMNGKLNFSTSIQNFPTASADISNALNQASAVAVYQLSPTSYEVRSYFHLANSAKTEHIELVAELEYNIEN